MHLFLTFSAALGNMSKLYFLTFSAALGIARTSSALRSLARKFLDNFGCARHSPNKFGSALACTKIALACTKIGAAWHNPSKLGLCSRLAQTFVFNRRLAAVRHSPSELGLCSRLAQTFVCVKPSSAYGRAPRAAWRQSRSGNPQARYPCRNKVSAFS